jgi:cold shock CspA family protein
VYFKKRKQKQMTGILIVWFERGFGFITTEDRQQYFLHVSKISEGPAIPVRGMSVEFEAIAPTRGKLPEAVNARIAPVEVRP